MPATVQGLTYTLIYNINSLQNAVCEILLTATGFPREFSDRIFRLVVWCDVQKAVWRTRAPGAARDEGEALDWKAITNSVLLVGLFVAMVTMFNQVNGRLDTMNQRIDALNERIDTTQAETNRRFDGLLEANQRQHDSMQDAFQRRHETLRAQMNRRFDTMQAESRRQHDAMQEALRVL